MHESSFFMSFSMFFLAFCSIIVGFIFNDIFLGYGSYFFNGSLSIIPNNFVMFEYEFLLPMIKVLPLLLLVLSILPLILLSADSLKLDFRFLNFFAIIFFNGLYFNDLYNTSLKILYKMSYNLMNKILDKGFLELFGPFGLYKIFKLGSKYVRNFQPYVLFFIIGHMYVFILIFIFIIFSYSFFINLLNLNVLVLFTILALFFFYV